MFSLRPGNFMNNITIQKNLAYNIGKTDGTREGTAIGIIVNDDSQNYTANNWKVTGNTFVASQGNDPWYGVVLPGGTSSKTVELSNNVVTGFTYQPVVSHNAAKINGLQIKDNIVYNGSDIVFENGNPANYVNSNNREINPQLNSQYISALGVGYQGNEPPPPAACTYIYSAWGECVNGIQTRTVISASPAGCTGTPVLTQPCTIVPPPTTKLLLFMLTTYNADGSVMYTTKYYNDGSNRVEFEPKNN